jgi:hypothetical protein
MRGLRIPACVFKALCVVNWQEQIYLTVVRISCHNKLHGNLQKNSHHLKIATFCPQFAYTLHTNSIGFTYKLGKLEVRAVHYMGPQWGHFTKKKCICKSKGKVRPVIGHEGPEGE